MTQDKTDSVLPSVLTRRSVVAMLLAACLAVLVMARHYYRGFGGARGWPFPWYWHGDVIRNGEVVGHYVWTGLIADIVFWVAVIVAVGAFATRIGRRSKL